jgi:hypothetical protein
MEYSFFHSQINHQNLGFADSPLAIPVGFPHSSRMVENFMATIDNVGRLAHSNGISMV